jgi:hypothetical protein
MINGHAMDLVPGKGTGMSFGCEVTQDAGLLRDEMQAALRHRENT